MEKMGNFKRRRFIALVAVLSALGVSSLSAGRSSPAPARGGKRSSLRLRWKELVRSTEAKQADGYDISPVIPYLKEARGAARHKQPAIASEKIGEASTLLTALPVEQPPPSGPAEVRVDASSPGDTIPRLAGSVVLQDLDDDPRFERFMREIEPGLILVKLFLSNLDEDHSNYQFLGNPGTWSERDR